MERRPLKESIPNIGERGPTQEDEKMDCSYDEVRRLQDLTRSENAPRPVIEVLVEGWRLRAVVDSGCAQMIIEWGLVWSQTQSGGPPTPRMFTCLYNWVWMTLKVGGYVYRI